MKRKIEFVPDLITAINARPARSAWDKGVKEYAIELCENIDIITDERAEMRNKLLNGAECWGDYSYGGCALIYDSDIAERLCTPSELKRTRNGERNPNGRECWLDVQTRALRQASWIILNFLF